MTTTPERNTPEQIIEQAMSESWDDATGYDSAPVFIERALRAAGLLVGDPTEEQIERAADALRADGLLCHMDGSAVPFDGLARAALTAAGVAPQEPSEDRSMQIARELARAHAFTTVDALSIANAALALAAPPSLAQRYLSDEQVEAAARALWAGHGLNGEWESGTHEMHEDCREDARNALIAAAGVALQPLGAVIHARIEPRTHSEREAWGDGFASGAQGSTTPAPLDPEKVAEVERAAAARAVEEAADAIRHKQHPESVRQMLRARAAEIQDGE